jgi:hypothetical protein
MRIQDFYQQSLNYLNQVSDFYQQSLNTIDFYQQSLINDKVALCFRYTEFITNINSKAIYSITKSCEQQQVP